MTDNCTAEINAVEDTFPGRPNSWTDFSSLFLFTWSFYSVEFYWSYQ